MAKTSNSPAKSPAKLPTAGMPTQRSTGYKKAASSPIKAQTTNPQTSSSGQTKQSIQVFVDATKSNDIILRLELANGQPPFVHFTEQWLRNNPSFMYTKLGINQIHHRADPSDPRAYKTRSSNNGRERYWLVLVKIVCAGETNNSASRLTLANNFVHFWNHPDNQRLYKYNMRAHFAGDTTPQDQTAALPMSNWLTIEDTMAVCQEAIGPDEDDLAARADGTQEDKPNWIPVESVLRHDDALQDYYMPEHYALVLQDFAGVEPGMDPAVFEQPGTFHGLPDFTFGVPPPQP